MILFEQHEDSIFLFIGKKSYKELEEFEFPEYEIAKKTQYFINEYTDSIISDEDGDGSFDYKDNGEVF